MLAPDDMKRAETTIEISDVHNDPNTSTEDTMKQVRMAKSAAPDWWQVLDCLLSDTVFSVVEMLALHVLKRAETTIEVSDVHNDLKTSTEGTMKQV